MPRTSQPHFGQHPFQRALVTVSAVTLILGAAGCAPEPGEAAGTIDKETQTTSPETEWGGKNLPAEALQTTLPESFPIDTFVIPAGATVYNTGESGADQWFLVLQAESAEAAQALWESMVSVNSFAVDDQVETSEGGTSATLVNALFNVQAITIPQQDGSVQLSYAIHRG